jgi:hypothetical protein
MPSVSFPELQLGEKSKGVRDFFTAALQALTPAYLEAEQNYTSAIPAKLHGDNIKWFSWFEMVSKGSTVRTRSHHSPIVAVFNAHNEAVNVDFPCPRGVNPPFGKTGSAALLPGDLLIWPGDLTYMIQSGHGRSWDKPFALWFAVPLVDLEPDELMDYLKAVRTHRSKGQGSEKAFPALGEAIAFLEKERMGRANQAR